MAFQPGKKGVNPFAKKGEKTAPPKKGEAPKKGGNPFAKKPAPPKKKK